MVTLSGLSSMVLRMQSRQLSQVSPTMPRDQVDVDLVEVEVLRPA